MCQAAPSSFIHFNTPTAGSVIAIMVAALGLVLSAFNSGSEIAFFSLRPDDVEHIDDDEQRAAVQSLLDDPERLLATILIGNNLVNIMIVIVLNYAIGQMVTFSSGVARFAIETVLLTFLILLFGEVIPKIYATNYRVRFATTACGALQGMVSLFRPLSNLLVKSTVLVNKVVHRQTANLTTDDLATALEASNVDNEDEKELLEGILTFGGKTASEIMRPRVDVVALDAGSDFDTVVSTVIDTGYSRMPVYDGTPDDIKGLLYAKDLLPYIGKRDNTFEWQRLLRPPYFVPETRMIDDLLEDFRTKKTHMAIIVDEFGCTQGIVTLEDVLEEIVGDIDDEYDTEERFYTRVNDDTFLFDGKTPLSDFTRVLDIDDESLGTAADDAETLAGLLLSIKGDFLKENETVNDGPFTFTVTRMAGYRIDRVRVHIDRHALQATDKA